MQQEPKKVYDHLKKSGIIDEVEEDAVRMTDKFKKKRRGVEAETSMFGREELLEELSVDADGREEHVSTDVLIDALTVSTLCTEISGAEALYVSMSLDALSDDADDVPVPDGFIRLNPNQLSGFLIEHDTALVLFWRPDCDPCHKIADRLAELQRDGVLDPIVLGAVRGTDAPAMISDLYDVAVAPTVLFCSAGQVRSRLIGLQPRSVIERQLDAVR